jgi:hypothetical protein
MFMKISIPPPEGGIIVLSGMIRPGTVRPERPCRFYHVRRGGAIRNAGAESRMENRHGKPVRNEKSEQKKASFRVVKSLTYDTLSVTAHVW